MKLKFNWLKIFWAIVITLAIILTTKILDKAKTWNDLILYIIGFTVLVCFLDEGRFQRAEHQRRLKNKEFPPHVPFDPNLDRSWPFWKRLSFNIFIYMFIFGTATLLLSFIIIPIVTSGSN